MQQKVKFQYIVQDGDEFQADDIYDLELVGGIITDNSFNMMPDERRKINFDTSSDNNINAVYRSYTQNFRVETTPPVLLDINGKTPDGEINPGSELDIYFKFSEPVYIVLPDGVGAHRAFVSLNSQYIDEYFEVSNAYGRPGAYYLSGNGTNTLKFRYPVKQNKFDPLEIVSTGFMGIDTDNDNTGNSYGEVYVSDSAGNKAPLLQNNSLKLSDNKLYVADKIPPEFSAQVIEAEPGEDGFYLKIDASDTGSGLDYDSLMFGFGGLDVNISNLQNSMKPLIPGKKYHSTELAELFGIDISKLDSFRVIATGKDKKNNYYFSPKSGYIWETVLSIDNIPPSLSRYSINKDAHSDKKGSFMLWIKKGDGTSVPVGADSVLDVEYKWVTAGTNPDMEEWIPVNRVYHQGMGDYISEGPGPSYNIYGDADLYAEAVDKQGNEGVFHIPKALTYEEITKTLLINQLCDMDISLGRSEGRNYVASVRIKNKVGTAIPFKGLWYCMTQEANMPEFSDKTGIWKYRESDEVRTYDYFGDNWDKINGFWYMHICAIDNNDKPICSATVPEALLFDFEAPNISVDEVRQASGSWFLKVNAIDNTTRQENIVLKYQINNGEWKSLTNGGQITIDNNMMNPRAYVSIKATDQYGNTSEVNNQYYSGTGSSDGKLPKPYVYAVSGSKYNESIYTNEDFVELEIYTSGNEFSYSSDGENWSAWLPLASKGSFTQMDSDKYYDLHNNNSYNVYKAYVPLEQKEGNMTFYTRYRKERIQSEPVAASVIRDVTPPTALVNYDPPYTTDSSVIASLSNISDNLCPGEAVKVLGERSHTFYENGTYSFIIEDVAGNKVKVKADVSNIYIEPPDTSKPVISITGTPDADITNKAECTINVTDNSPVSIKYVWTFERNWKDVQSSEWQTISNGSTVSKTDELATNIALTWYLHVLASDSSGNTEVASRSYIIDSVAPVISINPNGSENMIESVSTQITINDALNIEGTYVWSQNESPPDDDDGWKGVPDNGFVRLSGVDGIWYLYVKAVDAAGNIGTFKSEPFNMVSEYTEPYVVYSGEEEGEIRAFLVSQNPITVDGPVYCDFERDLERENPKEAYTATYDFSYSYGDGENGDEVKHTLTAQWHFPEIPSHIGEIDGEEVDYSLDVYRELCNKYKGTVSISPYESVTSGEVEIIIEAPTGFEDYDMGNDQYSEDNRYNEYGDYDRRIVFRDDEGSIEYLMENNKISILTGCIWSFDKEYDIEIVRKISEDEPILYNSTLINDLKELGRNVYLDIYKVKLITNVNTDTNGLIYYHVDDGKYSVRVNHIVDSELVGNVTSIPAGDPVGKLNNTVPFGEISHTIPMEKLHYTMPLLASTSMNGQSHSDLIPPRGKITYTADDWIKGPVTANIELWDNSGGKVTIANNNGSSSYVFKEKGQFVFEFYDEAGNYGRALAEVSTIDTSVPTVEVLYSNKLPTKDAVKVTLVPGEGVKLKDGDIKLAFENGKYSFDAMDNGEWEFTFENEAGRITEVAAKVDNIDRIPPKLRVDYISNLYSNSVTAIVRSDEIIWPVKGEELKYIFKENGQHVFTVQDAAGNEASITATVDYMQFLRLNQSDIDIKINYSTDKPTNKLVKISITSDEIFTVINNSGKTEKEVTKNGKYQFVVMDNLARLKLVEAEVTNIYTEDPVIKPGYPDEAVRNADGYSPPVFINGIEYKYEPLMFDAKQLDISIKGFAGPVKLKWTKGFETAAFFKSNSTELATDTQQAASSNTMQETPSGTKQAPSSGATDAIQATYLGTIPIMQKGWYTLYIYDNEKNSRLVYIVIDNAGGGN